MWVSGEIVTIIASAAAILFALAGGFGWIIVRMDAGFDRLSARIDDVHLQSNERDLGIEQRLVARMDGVAQSLEERLVARMDGVAQSLEERLVARMDGLAQNLEERLGARIDGVEERLGARIDGLEHRLTGVEQGLGARMDGLEHRLTGVEQGLVEVKVAVARLEGPPPRLVLRR